MLTPAFDLRQDEQFLYITIKARFAKIDETEIFMEDNEFKFYSKPYFLRLNLPGKIVEDGQESAKYDVDKGEFNIKASKVTRGEHFEGLDMLTKLLLPPKGDTSAQGPAIEVVGGEEEPSATEEEEEEFDWHVEQELYEEKDLGIEGPKYGFASQRSGVLKRLQEELLGVVDVPDPDSTPPSERRRLRVAHEQSSFSDDHYLADKYEDELIMGLIMFKPSWMDEYIQVNEGKQPTIEFTEEEKEKMRSLPRKEYLLDSTSQQQAFLSLVDILFAYAYNHRTTEGESTVESAWTMCKLSATLSWFETFANVHDVAVTCHRRSLCYPLYRHWKLASKVWMDVTRIFTIGKRRILKCLLEMHSSLLSTDGHYILNDLYITDYCVWIQAQSDKTIQSLADKLKAINLEKSDVELELEPLEHAASLVVEEQESTNQSAPNTSSPSADGCKKCSPLSAATASALEGTVDASFPKADLDLASSTDSGSDETDSDDDDDSGSEECESEEEEETKVANLSVISEETSINTSHEQSKSPQNDDDGIGAVTEQLEQLNVEKKTDSATLNF